ncbi:sensor domain-containing protein [Pseudalkalibacillus caeni]|uniref:EAL domain-containing protein n=1 Tax=Exobacillus caeni TaxID=2574798 RepID=A0A5R9F7M7_9BACL|nr:EAL domain-containing protein [Pseudalkalibacillus caeni]TLS38260.1 EAL domain-containing protein [Pseudalkalibacillus caeni]
MTGTLEPYNINYFFTLIGIITSISAFYLFFTTIQRINDEMVLYKRKVLWSGSVGVGLAFWISNLSISLSIIDIMPADKIITHFVAVFTGSTLIVFFVLKAGINQFVRPLEYFLSGLFISIGLLLVLIAGIIILFSKDIVFMPLFFVITFLTTTGYAYSAFRFVLQLARESSNTVIGKWKAHGSTIMGITFSITPYLAFFSFLKSELITDLEPANAFLILLGLELAAVWLLNFMPDWFGESKRLEQTARLQENQQHYGSLFENNPDAVFSLNQSGFFTSVNKVVTKMTGYSEEELKKMSFFPLLGNDVRKKALYYFEKALKGRMDTYELAIVKKDDDPLYLLVSLMPITINEEVTGVYGIAKDITQSKKTENMIHYLAYHDELTGLPNRRYFVKRVRAHIKKHKNKTFAVLLLDFDRFKKINDIFGHAFGDKVIEAIAIRLKESIPEDSVVSRIGGDEFTVFIPSLPSVEYINTISQQLIAVFHKPLQIEKQECLLTTSIGVSVYPEHGESTDELLKNADIAMYHVKDHGTNNYCIYKPEMNNNTLDKIIMENDLKRAIDTREVIVYYQPKFDTKKNILIGFEALARWNHPELGLISPCEFIPIAEETGLIIELEKLVLEQACEQMKQWHEQGASSLLIAVNLSQRHFYQEDVLCRINGILEKSKLEARFLEIEITESMAMFNEKATITKLNDLRDRGIQISIDDFGTGYSSLSYLGKLPINRLKIDKSFILDICTNRKNEAIVKLMISMADHLSLSILAEGVESKEQIDLLQELGCIEVQGYYYCQPVPAEEAAKFLKADSVV